MSAQPIQKKVIDRNVAIALGIICIILVVGIVGAVASYSSQINDRDSTIQSKNSQIANLQSQISDKDDAIESKDSQISSLNSQINTLKAPKLIMVNLKSDDNRPFLGTPYLHVYGYVCNVGTNTAYNCKLHVVAYQSGGVVAIDTYIVLGTISGESWTAVDASPTYGGGALTSWTITAEWSATP